MKYPSETIENSINEISKLPGIGKKTALRLSLHILKKEKEYSKSLADSIIDLKEKTMFCKQCHVISDKELCRNCDDENISIQKNKICVVEDTPDVIAIQNTNQYNGLFHVINGLISPINGVGPDNLNIDSLIKRIEKNKEIEEVIFALSPNLEGDTTTFYISKKLSNLNLKITTIARGVPIGGEIEYADEVTLGRSIITRINYKG
jgi:recombination protein RecR|tara:strand:+ start:691 stop:1305 length:615 start_codon:yes stop_codon:yes gene_type:complete